MRLECLWSCFSGLYYHTTIVCVYTCSMVLFHFIFLKKSICDKVLVSNGCVLMILVKMNVWKYLLFVVPGLCVQQFTFSHQKKFLFKKKSFFFFSLFFFFFFFFFFLFFFFFFSLFFFLFPFFFVSVICVCVCVCVWVGGGWG